jgi:hypothetical protein
MNTRPSKGQVVRYGRSLGIVDDYNQPVLWKRPSIDWVWVTHITHGPRPIGYNDQVDYSLLDPIDGPEAEEILALYLLSKIGD